jgi:hypothetical protein
MILLAAVYLMTLFPAANVGSHSDDTAGPSVWAQWEQLDFLFVPEAALPLFRPPRLDLVIDLTALRQMTDDRVHRHVERAFDLGAPYVYSMLRKEQLDADAPRVWSPLEQRYWPNPVPPRVDKNPPAGLEDGPLLESDYAHLAGWRRLRV